MNTNCEKVSKITLYRKFCAISEQSALNVKKRQFWQMTKSIGPPIADEPKGIDLHTGFDPRTLTNNPDLARSPRRKYELRSKLAPLLWF
jgi:hypothetical protein